MYLDGKLLQMGQDEFEQEQILALEKGEMMLLWQLHCPNMGNAVEITTGVLLSPADFTCCHRPHLIAPPHVFRVSGFYLSPTENFLLRLY